jgi:hypothetical protein
VITYLTFPRVTVDAALERMIREKISAAHQVAARHRDELLRYAVTLSNRNGAPVQLYLDAGAGLVELYRIPAHCQAHREAVFSADPDCPPEAA